MAQYFADCVVLISIGIDAVEGPETEQVFEVLRHPEFEEAAAQKVIR